MAELICVRKFAHAEEAEVARKRLNADGIDALVETQEGGSMTPAVAAISKLMVREEDLRRALESLNIRKVDEWAA